MHTAETSQMRAVSALTLQEQSRLERKSHVAAVSVRWREQRADVFDSMGMHEFAADVRQVTRHAAMALIGGAE